MISSTNSSSENMNQLTLVSTTKHKVTSELVSVGLSSSEMFPQKRFLRKKANIKYNLSVDMTTKLNLYGGYYNGFHQKPY